VEFGNRFAWFNCGLEMPVALGGKRLLLCERVC
jgi:hypothetical protein